MAEPVYLSVGAITTLVPKQVEGVEPDAIWPLTVWLGNDGVFT